jgi:hypothetical protein
LARHRLVVAVTGPRRARSLTSVPGDRSILALSKVECQARITRSHRPIRTASRESQSGNRRSLDQGGTTHLWPLRSVEPRRS